MLEADVPLSIAKDFSSRIKEKAVGEKLLKSIKPGDLVVKIVRQKIPPFFVHYTEFLCLCFLSYLLSNPGPLA